MFTLTKEDEFNTVRGEAVVMEFRPRPIHAPEETECKALWLTASEADALLALCVLSPASAGDCEQALFGKLGAYVRSFAV